MANLIPAWGFPVHYRGRNGDGRTPFVCRLDLYVEHQFQLGRRARLALSVNVFNLFNQAAAVDYYKYELFSGQVSITEAEYLEGTDIQRLIDEQGLVRDPRFLMDKDYQPPRSIRLGARISF